MSWRSRFAEHCSKCRRYRTDHPCSRSSARWGRHNRRICHTGCLWPLPLLSFHLGARGMRSGAISDGTSTVPLPWPPPG